MNRKIEGGYIHREPQLGEYIHGDHKLGDAPVNPGGQWDAYLPPPNEEQDTGFEAMDCVTNAVRNAVFMMIKEKYGDSILLSERFLAFVSGTTQFGNDPQTVAEALRTKGNVLESEYPRTPDLDTWEKFYVAPSQELYDEALLFVKNNSYGHSWVTDTSAESLKAALAYSPLTVGVFAWTQDQTTGYYIRPQGTISCHEVVIYGYEDGKYWKIFDSYENDLKKLSWDFGFDGVKRHTLNRVIVPPAPPISPVVESIPSTVDNEAMPGFWERIWEFIQKLFGWGDYAFHRTFGAARSSQWPQVRNAFIKANPNCAVCGKSKQCEVHHKNPFHIDNSLELNPANLITLCRDHHFLFGHLMTWASWNTEVETDGKIWSGKIKQRP